MLDRSGDRERAQCPLSPAHAHHEEKYGWLARLIGRGKPVLIMRIGFFACFHAISLETQSFQQNRHVIFHVLVALAYLDRV